ncbi:MAG: co-chaperone YbbN, partial [Halomonas sp.]|nr:co-chaperone YbbN [Halomonas sp.]
MSIIDPRTGNPLTAEPANTGNEEVSTARPSVTPEEVIIELNAGNIQQVLEASTQVPVLMGCYSPSNAGS